MSREIICKECGAKIRPMYAEDVAMGFQRRVVDIVARKPEDHHVKIYTGDTMDNLKLAEKKQVPSLVCDRCGRDITDGEPCKAVTLWRGQVEPALWEVNFNMPILHESKH